MSEKRTMTTNRILTNIYTDPKHWGSFASPKLLYIAAKQKLPKIKYKQVVEFLESQDAYTLHKDLKKPRKYRKTLSNGPYVFAQTDLADVSRLKKHNSGYTFLLCVICVFSRRAEIEPLRNKSGMEVIKGFKKIFKRMPKCKFLASDFGKEYLNKNTQKYFKMNNIKHFAISSDSKAAIAERFWRTFKKKLYRYFTHNNTLRYNNVLQDIVKSYNERPHSSLPDKMSPMQVTAKNKKKVWKHLYKDYFDKISPPFKYKINDKVRISKLAKTFKKGYLPTMSTEIFTIADRMTTNPPTYKLLGSKGDVIGGIWYGGEITRVK